MSAKIIIIDDDIDTLRLIKFMLEEEGYQILTAHNGKQGLQKIHRESPDLILLDVMMPEMDGYEVTRRLQKNPATEKIPILMFSAKSQVRDRQIGIEAGASEYLAKPARPEELLAHIEKLLPRTEKTKKEKPPQQKDNKPAEEKSQSTKNLKKIKDRLSAWFTSSLFKKEK